MKKTFLIGTALLALSSISCVNNSNEKKSAQNIQDSIMHAKVAEYADFKLTADISNLSPKDKKVLIKLIEASRVIDDLFWIQAYGEKSPSADTIKNADCKKFFAINYGPWDRFDGQKPFIKGFDAKPAGSTFYPTDMTKEEFENWRSKDKNSPFTLIRRDENSQLAAVPYHIAYKEHIDQITKLISQAAKLTDNNQFKKYLISRANALATDNYYKSDLIWMDLKESPIEYVVGPMETYEDMLFNIKTTYEAYLLIKHEDETKFYNSFVKYLPMLQKNLPVDNKYKKEAPGSDSDIGVYDAIYYAGNCNSAGKTIAINLPNDVNVQLKKGSRKLMLKNTMRAKFDKIVRPISEVVIDPSQAKYINFEAFFQNTMFHEIAHGLGVKHTINSKEEVRSALKDQYNSIDENKAIILGLFMVEHLVNKNIIKRESIMGNYVTFAAEVFRSIRFGTASSQGRANMATFNHLLNCGAFVRNEKNGYYTVNEQKMRKAIEEIAREVIEIEGNGDYQAAVKRTNEKSVISKTLAKDLQKIDSMHIPRDITFIQGPEIVGLSKF